MSIGLVLAFSTSLMGAFLTFSAYTGISVKRHEVLDSARLFTALSILSLLSSALNGLLQTYPILMAAFASIGRIEEFCMSEDQKDTRTCLNSDNEGLSVDQEKISGSSDDSPRKDESIAIKVAQATFGWDTQRIIKVPDFTTSYSELVAVSGSNGSGKSTFLKALLGEVSDSTGTVSIDPREIAYCDQTPW